MTEDHFLQYLGQVATPERQLVFQRAMEALLKLGISDHVFWTDQMMQQDDLGDASDFILEVEDMLNGAIHSLLRQFGVMLHVDCPLAMSTDILLAIKAMDNWSDPAALSAAAELDESPEVALAVMMEITGQHSEGDYLPHLGSVAQALIDRIDAVNQTTDDSALPTPEEHTRAHARLEAFFSAYSAPILSQAISEMLLIGGDYHGMMANYDPKISALAMEPAVNELVGFALASELPNDPLKEAILQECQGWWDGDATNATKLNALVVDRLKKVGVL